MQNHSKLYSVLSYITWIGWLIALLMRDKGDSLVRRHLNQGLIINLASLVAGFLSGSSGIIARLGNILSLAAFVFWIMGIVRAFKMSEEPLPFIGNINWIS